MSPAGAEMVCDPYFLSVQDEIEVHDLPVIGTLPPELTWTLPAQWPEPARGVGSPLLLRRQRHDPWRPLGERSGTVISQSLRQDAAGCRRRRGRVVEHARLRARWTHPVTPPRMTAGCSHCAMTAHRIAATSSCSTRMTSTAIQWPSCSCRGACHGFRSA